MKSTVEEIRQRFDGDVERFSNLETGQSATVDAPLAMALVAEAAAATTPQARHVLDVGCGAGNYTLKLLESLPNLDEAWSLVRQTAVNTINFLRGRVRYYPGMGTLIERFYTALRSGGPAPVGIAEGAEVVRVTEEIWRLASIDTAPARPPHAAATYAEAAR